jgi:hypothetical protein
MLIPELANFRLVGGTALSLLKGHRMSEDIDLFASEPYGSIDFKRIEETLQAKFPFFYNPEADIPALQALENHYGLKLSIGFTQDEPVKVDIINWGEPFLFPTQDIEGIRIATIEEIALMKMDAIARGGRKKDFWDILEILDEYSLTQLLELYASKYPYHDVSKVVEGLDDFSIAEQVPDPICLKGKHWELVKKEMKQEVSKLRTS